MYANQGQDVKKTDVMVKGFESYARTQTNRFVHLRL